MLRYTNSTLVSLLNDGSSGTLPPKYTDIMHADATKLLHGFNSTELLSSIGFISRDEQQKCIEQTNLMGMDLSDAHRMNYDNLRNFTRSSDAAINGGPDRLAAFGRYLSKLLGRRYIGAAASWLRDELQNIAPRVVSKPQQPYRSDTALSAPNTAKRTPPQRPKLLRRSTTKHSGIRTESTSKAVAKSRRSREDKQILAMSQEGPWECKRHGKIFTDRSNYIRHMTKTKDHGAPTFKCRVCGNFSFRIDHFQAHLENRHNLKARGRSGEYEYVPAKSVEDCKHSGHPPAAELVGSNAPVEMPAAFDDEMSFRVFA
jgi:hypothetical protein